jgi:hypothetical protein
MSSGGVTRDSFKARTRSDDVGSELRCATPMKCSLADLEESSKGELS